MKVNSPQFFKKLLLKKLMVLIRKYGIVLVLQGIVQLLKDSNKKSERKLAEEIDRAIDRFKNPDKEELKEQIQGKVGLALSGFVPLENADISLVDTEIPEVYSATWDPKFLNLPEKKDCPGCEYEKNSGKAGIREQHLGFCIDRDVCLTCQKHEQDSKKQNPCGEVLLQKLEEEKTETQKYAVRIVDHYLKDLVGNWFNGDKNTAPEHKIFATKQEAVDYANQRNRQFSNCSFQAQTYPQGEAVFSETKKYSIKNVTSNIWLGAGNQGVPPTNAYIYLDKKLAEGECKYFQKLWPDYEYRVGEYNTKTYQWEVLELVEEVKPSQKWGVQVIGLEPESNINPKAVIGTWVGFDKVTVYSTAAEAKERAASFNEFNKPFIYCAMPNPPETQFWGVMVGNRKNPDGTSGPDGSTGLWCVGGNAKFLLFTSKGEAIEKAKELDKGNIYYEYHAAPYNEIDLK